MMRKPGMGIFLLRPFWRRNVITLFRYGNAGTRPHCLRSANQNSLYARMNLERIVCRRCATGMRR